MTEEKADTAITEMVAFARSFEAVLTDAKTVKLLAKARQVFALKGVSPGSDTIRQRLESLRDVLE